MGGGGRLKQRRGRGGGLTKTCMDGRGDFRDGRKGGGREERGGKREGRKDGRKEGRGGEESQRHA